MLDALRRMGKTDDELADVMPANLREQFRPYLDKQAFARALERLAVSLMEAPSAEHKN